MKFIYCLAFALIALASSTSGYNSYAGCAMRISVCNLQGETILNTPLRRGSTEAFGPYHAGVYLITAVSDSRRTVCKWLAYADTRVMRQ